MLNSKDKNLIVEINNYLRKEFHQYCAIKWIKNMRDEIKNELSTVKIEIC